MASLEARNKNRNEGTQGGGGHDDEENPTMDASVTSSNGNNEYSYHPQQRQKKATTFSYAIYVQPQGCMCRFASIIFLALVVFFGGIVSGYYNNSRTTLDAAFALMAIGVTVLYSCIWMGVFWAVQRKRARTGPSSSTINLSFHLSTVCVAVVSLVIFLMGFFLIFKGLDNGYNSCYEEPGGDHGPCMETISVGIILVLLSHVLFGSGTLIARSCELRKV